MTISSTPPVPAVITNDLVLGVDIGGTNTALGLVDESGRVIAQSKFATQAGDPPGRFVERLLAQIAALTASAHATDIIKAISIASPAVNAAEGVVDNPANFSWGRVDLVGMLRNHIDLPTSLINDGDAAVLGETRFGVAKGLSNVIVITLGTGLGAGIVVEGKLVHGTTGSAGELGHMILHPEGRVCHCGRSGCVETYVSATGVRRTVFALLGERTDPSPLRTISYNDLTTDRIHEIALTGDSLATLAFERTGFDLGRMLADAAAIFDPEAVVLGGGLVNAGDFLIAPTRASFERHVLARYKGRVKILVSSLNNGQAAILGAASFGRDAMQRARLS